MITKDFDERTLANMELALERACETLSVRGKQHAARRRVAEAILRCAKQGETTLGGLTEAGRGAASRLQHGMLHSSFKI
jgi:hypothetical protein